jgi:hypothetical protein
VGSRGMIKGLKHVQTLVSWRGDESDGPHSPVTKSLCTPPPRDREKELPPREKRKDQIIGHIRVQRKILELAF